MKLFLTTLLAAFWFIQSAVAERKPKPVSIPFEVVGSYVVVKLQINESTTLHLILDSGVRNTIITELTAQDSLSINYSEPTQLRGLGKGEEIPAFVSKGNRIRMGKLELKNQTVMVLKHDIFNLSKYTGTKINGLIGADILQDYCVEVNYSRNQLIFHDTLSFTAPKKYKAIYLSLEGQKMFAHLPITELDGSTHEVKMLVDTGAELTAWFRTYGKRAVVAPDKTVRCFIGQGLNGEISGVIGRIRSMSFCDWKLNQPIVAFPDSAAIADIASENERDGTLGSQILNRFNLIFDLKNNLLYVKPNGRFRKKFSYNIAGIEILQPHSFMRIPEVMMLWKDSPAERAGVKVGDQIIEVNERKTYEYDINEIRAVFETPARSLRLVLMRNDEEIKVKISMKSGV